MRAVPVRGRRHLCILRDSREIHFAKKILAADFSRDIAEKRCGFREARGAEKRDGFVPAREPRRRGRGRIAQDREDIDRQRVFKRKYNYCRW